MAENKNLVANNRVKLEEVIPLNTPFSLCIDPSNLCNFKCVFCAMQTESTAAYFTKQFMEYDLFCKIIDEIKEFPEKLKVLRIGSQGEPTLNPHFIEMVTYAKKSGVSEFVEMITNGSKLEPEFNQRLIDSGIDRVRISVESVTEEGYYNIAKVKIKYNDFLNNIKDLHGRSGEKCEIYCKIVDAAVPTKELQDKFYKDFDKICDRFFIDRVIPLWSDFEKISDIMINENETGLHGQKIVPVKICPYPFYSLIITPDGDVIACCADWKRNLVFGNLNNESLYDVWHGEKLRNFWKDLAAFRKDKYKMCQKCLLPMYDCNDNIDEFSEELLKKI